MEEHKINIKVDTGTSVKDLEKLENALHDVDAEIVPLTSIMGELEDKLMLMAHAGDTTSEEFKKMAKEAAGMRKTIRLTDEGIEALSMTTSQKLGGALGGVASGFEAAQGVMASFGANSQAVEEALLKVQSAMAMAQGFQGIRESIPSFKAMGASATEAFGKMSAGAKAFAVTGIGVLITGIGLLIANFDKLKSMFDSTSEKQKVLNSTMDAYRTGAASAKMETDKVSVAFEQAKKGVIKKEEALKIYNDTLGSTMGKQDDVNKAESEFIKKKDAYIQAAALRAQAQAVMQLASEEYAKGLTQQLEDQRNWQEKTASTVASAGASILNYATAGYANYGKEVDKAEGKVYKQSQDRAKKASEDRQKILQDAYKGLLKNAEDVSNKYGLISEEENALNEERAAKQAEALAKQKELAQQAADAKKASLEEIKQAEKEYQDSLLTDEALEIQNAEEKYQKLLDLAKKYGEDTTQLEYAKEDALNNIRTKYADERQAKEDADKEKSEAQKKIDSEKEQAFIKQQDDIKKELKYLQTEEQFGVEAANYQRSKDALTANFDEKMTLFTEGSDQYLSLADAKEAALAKLDEDYKKAELQRAVDARNAKLDVVKSGLSAVSDLVGVFAGKSKKQQEKAFKVQKAINIANATIDTYKAATSAFAYAPNPIVGAVFAAIAVAAGIANIAKIAKTKFDAGGDGGSGGTVSADSGGGGTASVMTPQFNIVGNNPLNQLASLQTQPVRAYVVSGEVSTAQSMDRNRVQNATL